MFTFFLFKDGLLSCSFKEIISMFRCCKEALMEVQKMTWFCELMLIRKSLKPCMR